MADYWTPARIIGQLLVHVAVFAGGLHLYFRLCRAMRNQNVAHPPDAALLALIFTYGNVVMPLLTILFLRAFPYLWFYEVVYLLVVAPFVMLACALSLWKRRPWSAYHKGAFAACLVYELLTGAAWAQDYFWNR